MATGFKSFLVSGVVLVQMTQPISQMLGYVDTNAANGSVIIPAAPAGKTLFFAVVELSQQDRYLGKRPAVSLNGNTLTWQYSYQAGWGFYSLNCRIHYGYR